MPELPEVETIRRGLEKHLVGHTIVRVDVRLPKQVNGPTKQTCGALVTAARRFGKGLVIDLDNGFSIAIHVKMTGQLVYRRQLGSSKVPRVSKGLGHVVKLPDKYTHVVISLDNDAVLFYRDIRQFGWIKVVPTAQVLELPFFKSLGPEPLRDLDFEIFSAVLKKRKTPIKSLLMDQRLISGIGNIYANDALWCAQVNPKRPANSLTQEEQKRLLEAIETVLRKGIEAGGASEWQYVNILGEAGQYQNFFQVYRKDGKSCSRCGATIKRIKMSGRGTFYCPECQKSSLANKYVS